MMLLAGIVVVVAYMLWGRHVRQPLAKQLLWIVAFSQGLAAVFPYVVVGTFYGLLLLGVLILIVMLMALLADRSR